MEKSKVDMFLAMNATYFRAMDLPMIKSRLDRLDDEKFYLVQSMQFQKPDIIFIIAILLGWERFFLNDVVMGILKIITAYGCMIWWLVDLFTAKQRAYEYNLRVFDQALSMA